MIVLDVIRSFFLWVIFLAILIWIVLWISLNKLVNPSYTPHHFFIKISKFIVWISGVKLNIHGLEHIDPDQSYIVTFNHFNFFDHFFLYGALGIKLTGLEKEHHLKLPIYGQFMKHAGIIPIPPRGNTEKAMQALDAAKSKMIEEGFSILIAPEGTRCRDGKLGRFKKGAFYMAIQTGQPILPVAYDKNMYHFHGRGRFIIRPCEINLHILRPLATQDLSDKDVPQLVTDLRSLYIKEVGETYL